MTQTTATTRTITPAEFSGLTRLAESYRVFAGRHGYTTEVETDYSTRSLVEVTVHSAHPEVYIVIGIHPGTEGQAIEVATQFNRGQETVIPTHARPHVFHAIRCLPKPQPRPERRGASLWAA